MRTSGIARCSVAAATSSNSNTSSTFSRGDWSKVQRSSKPACTDPAALDKSLIPTRHFQRSLRRLPVPQLGETLRRYGRVVQPLVSPSQYHKTADIIRHFELQEGPNLQDELCRVDKANQHTSYISSDWFEKVLAEREPVPLHRHASMMLGGNHASSSCSGNTNNTAMLLSATQWIVSSVLFYKRYLDNELFPSVLYKNDDDASYYNQDWFERTVALCPEYFSASLMSVASNHHAYPLDVSQHDNLFNSTRVPGVLQDEIRAVGFMPHITVQYHGHQFLVTVADAECNPLPASQIFARLKAIVDCRTIPPEVDVSVFTSLPRTEWNGVRTALLRDTVNQQSMEDLETSMFVLNLDDDVRGGGAFTSNASCADWARVHTVKAGNRWWDKSLSVSVGFDGTVSVGCEESWGDGEAVRRYTEDVYQDTVKRADEMDRIDIGVSATEPVRQTRWRISQELKRTAVAARARLERDAKQTDVSIDVLHGLSAVAAQHGVQAESIMQLAVQLAWWRVNLSPVSACEPISMGTFLRGRSDRVFGATNESQEFTVAMSQAASPSELKKSLCLRALEAYSTSARDVANGGGIAAHLYALRTVSRRLYGKTPALFTDPSYSCVENPIVMITPLQVHGVQLATAKPTKGGYGITYTTVDDHMLLNVTSWKGLNGPRHSAEEFTSAITQSVQDIYAVLTTTC